MRYFSMFTGIGGFEKGINQAYERLSNNEHARISEEPQQEERSLGRIGAVTKPRVLLHTGNWATPLCVGYSEIDKYATKVYERHYEHDNYGDATKINPTELPDFDLLVGGFPCQAFSIAGKRRGFDDTRGTLFFDIARILTEKRPRHLVLENVKGLLSHDSGKTFQTILGVLTDLGYRVEWQVLNSKDFGVPQNRERVYIVGHLGNGSCGKVFPITNSNSKTLRQIVGGSQGNRVYDPNGIAVTQASQAGGLGAKTGLYIAAQRGRENGQVLEPQLEDKSNTLTAVAKDNYVVDIPRIRRLTPTECERLQGFPDSWTSMGVELVTNSKGLLEKRLKIQSDTQRYKQCGNAVTVNTVQAVISGLYETGCL